MHDLKVKSIVHDYEVKFIEDSSSVLDNEIKDGDVIIMDQKIKDLYPMLTAAIPDNNVLIDIDAHENQKSYEALIPIINKLIESGFRKNNRLIGIGGGITQDITAFTASIMYRGVNWIFFPTTLLAQGDSCIGSKTSINFGAFKNQVGGFYPPNKIYLDLDFLNTLTHADQQSGLGEKGIKEITETIPQQRLATVEEIAKTVVYLASDHNTYIAGQNIIVDGGFTSA